MAETATYQGSSTISLTLVNVTQGVVDGTLVNGCRRVSSTFPCTRVPLSPYV